MGDKDASVSKLQHDLAQLNAASSGMSKMSAEQAAQLQKQAGGLSAQLQALQVRMGRCSGFPW